MVLIPCSWRSWTVVTRRCVQSSWLALAVLLLLWPGVAAAQSAIAGAVRDSTGGVIPGVTVEAASPALIEKVRSATTDGQGRYSIVDIRPGVYTVTFTLTGFQTVRREGVEVAANVTVPISIELQVGTVAETITVTGATPVVDLQRAGQSAVLNREVLDTLPNARNYITAGIIMPGLRSTGPNMGGAGSLISTYLMARGRDNKENTMEVDGLDGRSSRGDGQQPITNYTMAQEVTYQTNAVSAEASGGGLRISMVPREGGNNYAGELYAGGMNNNWQANNITQELKDKGLPTATSTRYLWETSPAYGGRIIRDRLWFFGSTRWNRQVLAPAGATYFATGEPGYNNRHYDNYSGRITWQASQRNKITFFHDQNVRYESHFQGGNTIRDWCCVPTSLPLGYQYIETIKWTSPVSNRLLLEAGYARFGYKNGLNIPQPGIKKTPGSPEWFATSARIDLATNIETVANDNFCCDMYKQPTRVYQGAVSYVTGSHSFKAGASWRTAMLDQTTEEMNGSLKQRYRNGVPESVSVAAMPTWTKAIIDPDVGVYAQDAWAIKRLTVNAGVRFDYFQGVIGETNMAAGRFVPARSVQRFNPLPSFSDVSPRLSAVYDLFGNAKTALKANASRYVAQYGTTYVSPYNPISRTSDTRNWVDCDYNPGTSTCSGRVLSTNGDNIAQLNEIGPANINPFGTTPSRRADDNLARTYNWDYSVSIQHELVPRIAVVGAWYYSKYGNLQANRNQALTVNDYTPFQIVNPMTPSEMITVYNLNRSAQGKVDNVVRSSDINTQTYTGYEFSVQARLGKGAVVTGGWYTDLSLAQTCDTNDPNLLRYCDQTGKLYQDQGVVPALPYQNEFKVAATSPLPWDFRGSLQFASLPGNGGITSGVAAPLPFVTVTYAVPAALYPGGAAGRTVAQTVPLNPPGSQYLDRINQLDMNIKRTFHAGKVQLEPGFAIYNLFNVVPVLLETTVFGSTLYTPTQTLQGRFLKLEIMVKF